MKAARKATIVLLLGMGVAAPAYSAQTQTQPQANFSTAVSSSQFLSHTSDVARLEQVAQTTETSQLNFVEHKDHSEILKKYPFLKDQIAEVEHDDAGETKKTIISIATFHDNAAKRDFVFVSLTGPEFCGSLGCSVQAYTDFGQGYKDVLDVVVIPHVSVVSGDGTTSVILEGVRGSRAKWTLKGDQFSYVAAVPDSPQQQSKAPAPR